VSRLITRSERSHVLPLRSYARMWPRQRAAALV
jgi:hypothetical protein